MGAVWKVNYSTPAEVSSGIHLTIIGYDRVIHREAVEESSHTGFEDTLPSFEHKY
jgi:hypothetical protein